MARRTVFMEPTELPDRLAAGSRIGLNREASHHLVTVLRARVGDPCLLLDGQGLRATARLADPQPKAAQLELLEVERVVRQAFTMRLCPAVLKGKAFDLLIRLATEIGATRITPLLTEHTEAQVDATKAERKRQKWHQTAIEACKQCGNAWLPEIEPPRPLAELLAAPADDALRLVASLEPNAEPLTKLLDPAHPPEEVWALIGPEGDFSPQEYPAIAAAGFKRWHLTRNILRGETAAAYALATLDQALTQSHAGQ